MSVEESNTLAAEQAALRRVATLVARGTPPEEVFAAITEEVGRMLPVDFADMSRFDPDGAVTFVAAWGSTAPLFHVGSRWMPVGKNLCSIVAQTGRPARIDSYADASGPIDVALRTGGVRSAVGTPIVVEGRVWGLMAAGTSGEEPMPADTEARLTQFTELLATAVANAESRASLARLAEEQAALRRVATLIAREASQAEVFTAIAEECAQLLGTPDIGMVRYEGDRTQVVLASAGAFKDIFPMGSRQPLGGDNAASRVFRTGQPARIDDYGKASGPIAEALRPIGLRGAVGTPIMVEGRLWGAMITGTTGEEPLPPDTEYRLGQFTELMATAIANAESHARAEQLAEEQAALRRVATLVAKEAPPAEVFAKVVEELANVLGDVDCSLFRDESDGTATVVALCGERVSAGVPVGTRLPVDGDGVIASVLRDGRPCRIGDYSAVTGAIGTRGRDLGIRSGVGCPVVVGGRIWGAMGAVRYEAEALPPETETRIAHFADLLATAIANADARAEVERLAQEQAALRRVAMLVTDGAAPAAVFEAVAAEMERVLDADGVTVSRYEPGTEVTVVGHRGVDASEVPPGTRWNHEGENVASMIRRTERPARMERYAGTHSAAPELAETLGTRAAVGAPIVVEGRLWGFVVAYWQGDESPPAGTEARMAQFAQLLDSAIANVQARSEVERLAEQHAALRRIATMVARECPAEEIFAKVAEEVAMLLGVDVATVRHFGPDGWGTIVGRWGDLGDAYRVGSRLRQEGDSVTTLVYRTGRSARFDDYSAARAIPADARALGLRGAVASPIVVNGRLWGAIAAGTSTAEPMPADAESRIAEFTELVATAISNVQGRSDLATSRARIVAAADQERRRVVRDLHDGTQQRLVHTIVTLGLAQQTLRENRGDAESLIGEALEHAKRANSELRKLAHGILPSTLTHGGLRAGVDAVLSRLDLPVQLDVPAERFPAETEASAYFIVAEALTNVVKHSRAEHAQVRASVDDGMLRVEIRDDGIGGADPNGHGLVGMGDRVTALGGRLEIDSPPGGGTLVAATLPLSLDRRHVGTGAPPDLREAP